MVLAIVEVKILPQTYLRELHMILIKFMFMFKFLITMEHLLFMI
jgi:hypothetical protein